LNKESIGQIGIVNEFFVQGWGKYLDSEVPAKARLFVNNSFVDETIANQYRPNLEHLSHTGNCGFRFDLSKNPLKDGDIVSPMWIEEMLMHSQRLDVGCVEAKLYYPLEKGDPYYNKNLTLEREDFSLRIN